MAGREETGKGMATRTGSEETRRMVLAAADACESKKAEETRILELDPADSGFTDFFLIASGANPRQTEAIADEVELRLKRDFGAFPNSVEGRRVGEWILMDYVDFVVHIFLAERRAFYDIERLRKSAKPLDIAELKAALRRRTADARTKVASLASKKTAAKKSEAQPASRKKASAGAARKTATKAATSRKAPASSKAAGSRTKAAAGKKSGAKKSTR
jgi:ribosome-associated protein